jgi:hypothetical protein
MSGLEKRTTLSAYFARMHKTPHLSFRYKCNSPQSFSNGDIVEVRLSFLIIPVKQQKGVSGHFKMVIVLCSLALIDNCFSGMRFLIIPAIPQLTA